MSAGTFLIKNGLLVSSKGTELRDIRIANGVFTEISSVNNTNTASYGMGVDVGDVNNDGWLDIYIANLGANFLLLNNGDGTFSNISESSNCH